MTREPSEGSNRRCAGPALALAIGVTAAVIVAGGAVSAVMAWHSADDGMPTPTGTRSELGGTFYGGVFLHGRVGPSFDWQVGSLHAWTADDRQARQLANTVDDHFLVGSLSVSPDGRYASWTVKYHDHHVMVRDLASGADIELTEFPGSADHCSSPVWAPDGRRLFVDRGADHPDGRFGFFDVHTGEFTASVAPPGCVVAVTTAPAGGDRLFSVDGEDENAEIYVTGPDGSTAPTGVREVLRRHDTILYGLTAVSPDNALACVPTALADSSHETGHGHPRACDSIVDLNRGDVLDLGTGWHATPAVFDLPCRLLTYADGDPDRNLRLRSLDGHHIGEIPTPRTGIVFDNDVLEPAEPDVNALLPTAPEVIRYAAESEDCATL